MYDNKGGVDAFDRRISGESRVYYYDVPMALYAMRALGVLFEIGWVLHYQSAIKNLEIPCLCILCS